MRVFLRFIIANYFVILFVLIEATAISLVLNYNNYQRARTINTLQSISGYLSKRIDRLNQYLTLRPENERLTAENARLQNIIQQLNTQKKGKAIVVRDALQRQQYTYISAHIINNSINKQFNYLMLDRGREDSIKPEMAVISDNGVVGITESVTEHYCLVISVLNRNFKISAKIKKNNYFGSFEWSGTNYRKGILRDIPLHVQLERGDTIITSGFSTIFPENVLLGNITDYSVKGGNFYEIEAELSNDFKNLTNVYVVANMRKSEQETLNKLLKND